MACLYCGKDVPFRMRLTGEEQFCCPAHKRLYHEEHSRMGLERLLEEVQSKPEETPKPAAQKVLAQPVVEVAGPEDDDRLPEPQPVYSGQGLKLWVFPYQRHAFEARFDRFMATAKPAGYTPGVRSAQTVVETPAATAEPTVESVPPPVVAKPPDEEKVDAPVTEVRRTKAAPASRKHAPATQAKKKPAPARKKTRAPEKNTPSAEKRPSPAPAKAPAAENEIDLGGISAAKKQQESSKGTYRIAAGVVLAICLGAGGYLGLGIGGSGSTGGERVAQSDSTAWQEWIPDWSDSEEEGAIALFGPSQEWSDYRVQFSAENNEGLSWVFRAADKGNYYAVRIRKSESGDLEMVRYAVVGGDRLDLVETPLNVPAALDGSRMAVELEVKGSQFVLFLEGHNVAEWSDERLPTGGFGVVRPDVGLAGVDDVKVTQLNGQSAVNQRFWRGLPPDSLPEVTLLPASHTTEQEAEEL